MTRFFAIALGSNIGERLFYLNHALAMIDRIDGLRILAASRIYESKGWGRDDLDPFLNAVLVAASDSLDAQSILVALQEIENKLGRQRDVRWGARTLDLDLLAVNDEVSDDPALTLPHPYIADRPFVYLPFREVANHHAAFARLVVASDKGNAIEADSKVTTLGDPVWGATIDDATGPALQWQSQSEEQTHQLAHSLASFLLPGDVIALNAPLGSGKSVFARGIAHGLGVIGHVASPTYLLCKTYETRSAPLEHWDFYRLESQDDLESTGYFSPPPGATRV
ncbi:MAG: 2-amino-4-hydroxy-6-hydroxymethyldihydropteridine diphosphokinase, partial [Candidatus Sumerlaeota bacterium]